MISPLPKLAVGGVLLIFPQFVLAEGFVKLVGVPGLNPGSMSTAEYINALYILSISVAAFLAVARIILAGVQYVLTDIVPAKDAARKQITGALLGLLIVISAVLVLETINPQLTNFAALDQLPKREFSAGGGTGSTPGGGSGGTTEEIVDNRADAENRARACGGTATQISPSGVHSVSCPKSSTNNGSGSGPRYSGTGEVKPGDVFIGYQPAELGFPEGPSHNQEIIFRAYSISPDTGLVDAVITEPDGFVIGCDTLRPRPPRCVESDVYSQLPE